MNKSNFEEYGIFGYFSAMEKEQRKKRKQKTKYKHEPRKQ